MLHVVYGPDTFSSRQFVRDLVASLMSDDPTGEGVARVDGRAATPTDILNACGQVSLFGLRPVVIVEGLLARFEPSKKSGARAKGRKRKAPADTEWSDFPERLRPVVDAGELILIDGELSSGNEMLSALKVAAEVHSFPRMGRSELLQWIAQRARAAGAGIEDTTALQLASQSQGDLWQLASEVDKLAAYCDGGAITAQAIAQLTSASSTSSIFWLVDAIVEGRARDAQRLLADLWESGSSAGHVLMMVERQLRIIAQALEATGPRGKVRLQGGEFAGLQEFAQRRALKQARGLSAEHVLAALDRVAAADRAVKTSGMDERVALELLIMDLVAVWQRR